VEVSTGVDTLGVPHALDGHGEAVAARIGPFAYGGFQLSNPAGSGGGTTLGRFQGTSQAVLVVQVGAAEPPQPGHVGVHRRLLQDERVAGGEGLDLRAGERLVADVVDLPVDDPARRRPG
jgi:hypothetical protein